MSLRLVSTTKIHQTGQVGVPTASNNSLAFFSLQPAVQWDGVHYLDITGHGYGQSKNALPAFYPAFPYGVRYVSHLTGIGYIGTATLINLLASLMTFGFLFLLARDFTKSQSRAFKVIMLFAFFPFSYFMLAYYTEAIFCALSFAAFYFARRNRWLVTGLLLAGLSMVRMPGLVVAVAVLVQYMDVISWRLRAIRPNILWLGLAPVGLGIYSYYLGRHFGDFLMFVHAYRYGWTYQVFEPNIFKTLLSSTKAIISMVIHPPAGWKDDWFQVLATRIIELGSWLVGVAILIYSTLKNRLPVSYLAYLGLSLLLFSLNSNFISVNRYLLPLFPIYLASENWLRKRDWLYSLTLASSAVAMGVFMVLFSNGFWTG